MIVWAVALGILRVQVRTGIDQEYDHPGDTRTCCSHESRSVFIVAQFDIETAPRRERTGCDRRDTAPHSGGPSSRRCVKRIAMMKEEMKHLEVIVHGGEVECAPSRSWLAKPDIRTGFEQESRTVWLFFIRSYGKREKGHALRIDRVGIAAGCEIVTQWLDVAGHDRSSHGCHIIWRFHDGQP